jgi:hypothetical protein
LAFKKKPAKHTNPKEGDIVCVLPEADIETGTPEQIVDYREIISRAQREYDKEGKAAKRPSLLSYLPLWMTGFIQVGKCGACIKHITQLLFPKD